MASFRRIRQNSPETSSDRHNHTGTAFQRRQYRLRHHPGGKLLPLHQRRDAVAAGGALSDAEGRLPPRLLADRPAHHGVPGDRLAAAAGDQHVRGQAANALSRLPAGMGCLAGRADPALATAHTYIMLLAGAICIGFGSAVFHSGILARGAAGLGRPAMALRNRPSRSAAMPAQAMGPLLAAFIVVPFGQGSVGWFAVGALVGIIVARQGRLLVCGASPRRRICARRAYRCSPTCRGARC